MAKNILNQAAMNEYQMVAANTGNEMESLNIAISMIRERNADAAKALYGWVVKSQERLNDSAIADAICRELVDGKERRDVKVIMAAIQANLRTAAGL